MAETPGPGTGAPSEEHRQLQRRLNERVLDRAASDSFWKRQLLDDPEAALRVADFPELKRVKEMRQSAETSWEAEVVGHVMTDPFQCTSRQERFLLPLLHLKANELLEQTKLM